MCLGIITGIAFYLVIVYLELPLLIKMVIRDSTDRKEEELKAIHKEQDKAYVPCFLCKNLRRPEHGNSYCEAIKGKEQIHTDGLVFHSYIELLKAKEICNKPATTKYERSWIKALLTALGA